MSRKDKAQGDTAGLRKRAEEMTGIAKLPPPEPMSPEEAGRTLQELQVHQIELQMQNEELRRTQGELDAARARYFDLYDLAPVGYVTVSEEGLILEANLAAAHLLGVERGVLVKRRLTSFILHECQDIHYLQCKLLFETGSRQVSELQMVRPDGAQFWARLEGVKAEGPESAPVLRIVIVDVTARKQTEEALQRSNTTLAGINSIFEEALKCKTEQGLGQVCVRVAKRVTGSRRGCIGKIGRDGQFRDLAMSEREGNRSSMCEQAGHGFPTCGWEVYRQYDRVLQDGKSVLINAPAGSPASIGAPAVCSGLASFLGVPLTEDGRIVGMIGVANRDGGYRQQDLESLEALAPAIVEVLHRKRAEAALLRSEKLASVGRMAASIAHEINNPLEAVMNALYLARTHLSDAGLAGQYLELADEELMRVAHITRQTLGFYRDPAIPTAVGLGSIMDSVLDLLRGKIRAKDAVIEKRYNGNPQLTAVAGELRQVFSNLLANSLDAIDPKGTIKLRIRRSACGAGGQPHIRVTVWDNGKGIEAVAMPHLFEPFFTTKESTGSGLGLWVSHQLVVKQGGSIRVRSSSTGYRRGTVFSISLPVKGAVPASV